MLTSLQDADQLIQLAYDLRVPRGASQVSVRDIRLSRITAAIALAGELNRRDDLLRLLLEASLVAAGHERSDRFLYEHPDLTAVAGDPEALRRLSATNVGWPGGKHAALALRTPLQATEMRPVVTLGDQSIGTIGPRIPNTARALARIEHLKAVGRYWLRLCRDAGRQ